MGGEEGAPWLVGALGELTFLWMLVESALRTLKSRRRAERCVCGPWIRTQLSMPEGQEATAEISQQRSPRWPLGAVLSYLGS